MQGCAEAFGQICLLAVVGRGVKRVEHRSKGILGAKWDPEGLSAWCLPGVPNADAKPTWPPSPVPLSAPFSDLPPSALQSHRKPAPLSNLPPIQPLHLSRLPVPQPLPIQLSYPIVFYPCLPAGAFGYIEGIGPTCPPQPCFTSLP